MLPKTITSQVHKIFNIFCFVIVFSIISMAGLGIQSVAAFTLSPTKFDFDTNGQQTFTVNADNTNTNGVSVEIKLSNIRIETFQVVDGLLSIGTCSSGGKYTEQEICVDVAATQNFTAGQPLIIFTVSKFNSAAPTIQVNPTSEYADGKKVPTLIINPSSSLQDSIVNNDSVLYILICVIAILMLAALIILFGKRKRKSDSDTTSTREFSTYSPQPLAPLTQPNPPILDQTPANLDTGKLVKSGSYNPEDLISQPPQGF